MKNSIRNSSTRQSSAVSFDRIIAEIKSKGNRKSLAAMARFGIQTSSAFGVSIPELRALAGKIGEHHDLAGQLWESGIHEARILASMIDNSTEVTEEQMERWSTDFDSWDVVDQICGNLFDKSPFAVSKAHEWTKRKAEFVKRAGFVLMAELAVHDRNASNKIFLDFLPVIVRESSDDRNFVRKAVNWSLRQIGKRNLTLNKAAVQTARAIQKIDSRAARWIAADAIRELTSHPVQKKLNAIAS